MHEDILDGKGHTEIIQLLRNVPIFYMLDEKTLHSVSEVGKLVDFEPNTRIVKQYQRDNTLYLILEGQVQVRKGDKVLAKLGLGQFFGEMAFLDDMPTERSADVVTTEETKCLAIPGWSWYNFLRTHPDVAIEVIRSLAARLRETSELLAY